MVAIGTLLAVATAALHAVPTQTQDAAVVSASASAPASASTSTSHVERWGGLEECKETCHVDGPVDTPGQVACVVWCRLTNLAMASRSADREVSEHGLETREKEKGPEYPLDHNMCMKFCDNDITHNTHWCEKACERAVVKPVTHTYILPANVTAKQIQGCVIRCHGAPRSVDRKECFDKCTEKFMPFYPPGSFGNFTSLYNAIMPSKTGEQPVTVTATVTTTDESASQTSTTSTGSSSATSTGSLSSSSDSDDASTATTRTILIPPATTSAASTTSPSSSESSSSLPSSTTSVSDSDNDDDDDDANGTTRTILIPPATTTAAATTSSSSSDLSSSSSSDSSISSSSGSPSSSSPPLTTIAVRSNSIALAFPPYTGPSTFHTSTRRPTTTPGPLARGLSFTPHPTAEAALLIEERKKNKTSQATSRVVRKGDSGGSEVMCRLLMCGMPWQWDKPCPQCCEDRVGCGDRPPTAE